MACAQELDEQNIPAEPHQAGATRSLSMLSEIITDYYTSGISCDVKPGRKRNRLSAIDQRQVSDYRSSCAYVIFLGINDYLLLLLL